MNVHIPTRAACLAALAVSSTIMACDGGTGSDPEPPGENIIGPEGGTVTAGALTLTVPADALSTEVEITVEPVTPASTAVPGGYSVVEGTAYALGPDGLVFNRPAEVRLAYGMGNVPPGVLEEELTVLMNNGSVTPLESTVDAGAGVIQAFVEHVSTVVVGLPEDEFQRVACPDLSPAASQGRPLDRIDLGRVPESFEPPLLARVEAVAEVAGEDEPLHSFTLVEVDEASEDAELVVPIHPSTSPDGGSTRMLVTDGTLACAPFDFAVQALEPAPGELAAIADHLQDVFREQAAVLGTSPEEIVATPVGELPPALYPLALVQSTLDHPDNDRSLAAIAAGSSPDADEVRLDLVEPLLARTGLRQELAVAAQEARRTLAAAAAAGDPGPPGPQRTISSDYCTPEAIGNDAGLLDACMDRAWDEAFRRDGASGEVLDDLGKAFGVAGLVPGLGTPTAIAGFVTWLMADLNKRNAALLPSILTAFTIDHDPEEFLEDDGSTGSWSDANLSASNLSWDMGQEVLEGLLAGAGVVGAFDKVQISKTEISDLMNYILTNPVAGEFLEGGTIEAFKTEPQTFGPVDATADTWTESRRVSGDAVELTAHDQYEPRQHGTSMISVRTEDGKFGGQQRADQFEVTVKRLNVDLSPAEVHLKAGEPQDFTVTVTDSEHPEMVELDASVPLQGTVEDITYVGEGLHVVAYTAPGEPNREKPDLLTVRHTAETGARGHSSEERNATATIRFGSLTISPRSACLDPGETLQFTAEVEGLDDETVLWSTDIGDIDENNGLYTADPDAEPGSTATITATSASQPDLTDQVTISIGQCNLCRHDVTVSGGMAGISAGPAGFGRKDGGLQLDLGSFNEAHTTGDPIVVGVDLESWTGETGTYSVTAASATHSAIGTAWYEQGVEGLDCPSCGGTLTIDRAEEESVAGSYQVTMPPLGFEAPPVTAVGTFRAHVKLPDVALDPYRECLFEYEEGG